MALHLRPSQELCPTPATKLQYVYIHMYVLACRRPSPPRFFDGVCAARAIRNAVWQLSPFKPGLRNRGVPNVLEWGDEPDDPKVTFSDNSSPRQLALLCLALPCLAHACSSSPSSLAISFTLLVFCFQSLAPALPCPHSAPNHPTSTPVNAKLLPTFSVAIVVDCFV